MLVTIENIEELCITQDDDVLIWSRDVGQARFPRISVMARQFMLFLWQVHQLNVGIDICFYASMQEADAAYSIL